MRCVYAWPPALLNPQAARRDLYGTRCYPWTDFTCWACHPPRGPNFFIAFRRASDYGYLGYGTTFHRGDGPGEMGTALPAVDLGPGLTAVAVVARAYHTCALLQPSDTIKCWG